MESAYSFDIISKYGSRLDAIHAVNFSHLIVLRLETLRLDENKETHHVTIRAL